MDTDFQNFTNYVLQLCKDILKQIIFYLGGGWKDARNHKYCHGKD